MLPLLLMVPILLLLLLLLLLLVLLLLRRLLRLILVPKGHWREAFGFGGRSLSTGRGSLVRVHYLARATGSDAPVPRTRQRPSPPRCHRGGALAPALRRTHGSNSSGRRRLAAKVRSRLSSLVILLAHPLGSHASAATRAKGLCVVAMSVLLETSKGDIVIDLHLSLIHI